MDPEHDPRTGCACEARRNYMPGLLASILVLLLAFLMIVALPGISADAPATRWKGKTVTGEARPVGNGMAWSWVAYGTGGRPRRSA